MWVNATQKWLLLFSRPNDPCDANSICGSFGTCNKKILPICRCLHGFEPSSPMDWNLSEWYGGCVRKTSLQCGHKDGFLKMPDMYMPTQNLNAGSAKECESACIRNCSCSAYSYSGGCSIWSGGLRNLKQLSVGDSNGTIIYIRLATSDLSTFKGKNKKILTMVIVVASMCRLALLGIILLLIWSKQLVGPSSAVQDSFSTL
ncbi:hypothetical protein GIB67_001932 [Kingdonia uniflora]|uniref:Apple domain-containing protein n=1 Tax=Kingdonia uniflora TaxID=39325 RepID=A0A7J7NVJ6_9MAGN|nr:hypothetical protein GIB67_001932 [Kingdonia uniflora]